MSFTSFPDIAEIVRNEGFLYWDPTSTSTEAGWGTLLGFTLDGVDFNPGLSLVPVYEEMGGDIPAFLLNRRMVATATAILQNYNAAVLARLFPGHASGAAVNYTASTDLTGKDYYDYEGELLFVPKDSANNPALYSSKATPHVISGATIPLAHGEVMIFPVVFVLRHYEINALGSITLA